MSLFLCTIGIKRDNFFFHILNADRAERKHNDGFLTVRSECLFCASCGISLDENKDGQRRDPQTKFLSIVI
jgi:hypothetical protein